MKIKTILYGLLLILPFSAHPVAEKAEKKLTKKEAAKLWRIALWPQLSDYHNQPKKRFEDISLAIENGIDINAPAVQGVSPLWFAASRGDLELFRILLHFKHLDKQFIKNGAVLRLFITSADKNMFAHKGDQEIIYNLNIKHGLDASSVKQDDSFLKIALENGEVAWADVLLIKGAKIPQNALVLLLSSPAVVLKISNNYINIQQLLEFIKSLLDHGIDPNARFEIKDYQSRCIHYWLKPSYFSNKNALEIIQIIKQELVKHIGKGALNELSAYQQIEDTLKNYYKQYAQRINAIAAALTQQHHGEAAMQQQGVVHMPGDLQRIVIDFLSAQPQVPQSAIASAATGTKKGIS